MIRFVLVAFTCFLVPTLSWAHGSHEHSAEGGESAYTEHEEAGTPWCDTPPCIDSPFIDTNGNGTIELEEAVSENLAYCDKNFDGIVTDDEKTSDNLDCTPLLSKGHKTFANGPIARFGLQKGELILTIDDGPNRDITPKILDLLASYNIKATFFLTGNRIASHAQIVRRMYNEGHTVGNHTFTHAVKVSPQNLRSEIVRAHQEIAAVLGGEPEGRLLFRAPGLAWSTPKAVTLNDDQFTRNYIGPIHANLGTDAPKADWSCWSKKVSAQQCANWYYSDIANAGRGVILSHDVYFNGSTRNTYEMLKIVLAKLDANGGIKNRNGQGFWKFVDMQTVQALDQYEVNSSRKISAFKNRNYNVRSLKLETMAEINDMSKIDLRGGKSLKTGDIAGFKDLNETLVIDGTAFRLVEITDVVDDELDFLIGANVLIGEGAF